VTGIAARRKNGALVVLSLTAAVMAFELCADYAIVLPLAAAASRRRRRASIYEAERADAGEPVSR
jgi:H+/Cl- antiporter ClcA